MFLSGTVVIIVVSKGVDCVDCSNKVVSEGVVAVIEVVTAMVDSATTKMIDNCDQYSVFSIIVPTQQNVTLSLWHTHFFFDYFSSIQSHTGYYIIWVKSI